MTYKLTNLNVASLDFDDIKASLISFLSQQEDLKDLDYRNEASSINLLLNILATATAYNGVYAQLGFVNSFATTSSVLESILGIASNSSVLITPVKSAKSTRTLTAIGVTMEDYTTFKATTPNGADVFFFNIDNLYPNQSGSISLYGGNEVIGFSNYDYSTQSCELPYTIDPDTINMYETEINTTNVTKWTRVDKSNTTKTSNNTHFTVMNGPNGYIVTNNFATAKEITTNSTVLIQGIVSNGSVGNDATIYSRSDVTFGTTELPFGGYNKISTKMARSKLLFKATGQERCVTLNDYLNAILSSEISGTDDETKITVANGDIPGKIKVYVTDLSSTNAEALMTYLSEKAIAGITVVYEQ